ncbi:zinc ribbon domain-containing protein [Bacillus canaveralius]|uniref:zinc ribbon domain-containing protein n=1 Tax=Bacillus canaveralius TaxID=1403243 RepID=UPI00115724CC|nr:zinc ribbon domain-containing protein [Bacillus canaveralius]
MIKLAGTDREVANCGGRHKANGRNFKCSVHNTEIHRDVNGAQNICRKRFAMGQNRSMYCIDNPFGTKGT